MDKQTFNIRPNKETLAIYTAKLEAAKQNGEETEKLAGMVRYMSEVLGVSYPDAALEAPVSVYTVIRLCDRNNDIGYDVEHQDGYIVRETGLSEWRWNSYVEDFDASWGVYLNEVPYMDEFEPPTEEEQDGGGSWSARTLESIDAWNKGPKYFFAHIVGGEWMPTPPPETKEILDVYWFE